MVSVQLQLRRDTPTNIAAVTPAQGEPIFDTVNRRLIIGDGQTQGGLPANGSYGQFGSSLSQVLLEGSIEALPTSSSNYSSIIEIPAGCLLFGVSYRIINAITGATSWEFGISGTPAKFASGLGTSVGSTALLVGPLIFTSATQLLVTSTVGGNFTGGAIRFALQYLTIGAPTS